MNVLLRSSALLIGNMISCTFAADAPTEPPKVPVPKSPYIAVVYRYADTMLEKGRDTYGPQKTGLFLSALDRTTFAPPPNLPAANPQHDENLLRLLYTLSELTLKPMYREAADAELRWLLQNVASPLAAWDVIKDEPVSDSGGFFRTWMLWDRCFDLAPESSKQFALGLQATSHTPRDAGFKFRTWAVAYARSKDEQFLKKIAASLDMLEKARETAAAAASLSLAIDCDGAALRVPEPFASRLRAIAAREDSAFCSLPHALKTKGGFVTVGDAMTPLWVAQSQAMTTAQIGMMCVARYENSGDIRYRELIHSVADAYLQSMPSADEDVWPGTFGHIISLELAAWRSTARQPYFDRAMELGNVALEKFFGKDALPRASFKNDHYESRTGADTLALALLDLHLHVLHITAVRCPSNTIDR
jgi:hypothetical protein